MGFRAAGAIKPKKIEVKDENVGSAGGTVQL